MLILLPLIGYLLGSLPMGLIYVRVFTGQDLRAVGSGRTGGTNAMRAAGLAVGLLTALSDIFKGTLAVWLAQWLLPAETRAFGMVLCGLGAILGHNYSLFLRFKGGAGGGPVRRWHFNSLARTSPQPAALAPCQSRAGSWSATPLDAPKRLNDGEQVGIKYHHVFSLHRTCLWGEYRESTRPKGKAGGARKHGDT